MKVVSFSDEHQTGLLSDKDLSRFRRDGYVVVPSLLGSSDLETINAAVEELAEQARQLGDQQKILEWEPEQVDGQHVPRRVYRPYDQHVAFRDLAEEPRILDRIVSLIGPSFDLHHSKLNMKPPRVGSVVHWHQDLAYFPHTNDDLVTTLVYLDEATEENGCLQVLPGHHQHYFDHFTSDGNFAGMITEDLNFDRVGAPKPLPAPAGSVIFMHCILPHSSLPNGSDKPRRTLIFEYRAGDSFPIYFGRRAELELARPLRGERARFARFGGPAPLIPKEFETSSLYALQSETLQRQEDMKGTGRSE